MNRAGQVRYAMVSKTALKSSKTRSVKFKWSVMLNIWSVVMRREGSVEWLRL